MLKRLDDTTFEKALGDNPLALVMFYAPWAGPCNIARPSFTAAAMRFGNQMMFADFNLDDNPDIPEKYGVKAVPVFYLFVDGKPTVVKAGAITPEAIIEICESALT